MTDLERVTERADSITNDRNVVFADARRYILTAEELLSFERETLKEANAGVDRMAEELNKWKRRAIATKEVNEQLNAKLAMQAEAISNADVRAGMIRIRDALNATQADVDAWNAKKKAEIEKDVLEKAAKEFDGLDNTLPITPRGAASAIRSHYKNVEV